MKKIVSFVLLLSILSSMIYVVPINAATVTNEQFIEKINSLRNTFRHGEYWNSYSSSDYSQTGTVKCPCGKDYCAYKGVPCSCECAWFIYGKDKIAQQCRGYACKLGNLIFGGNPNAFSSETGSTGSWSVHKNYNSVYAGDLIKYGSGFGHTVFVYKVENGKYYYTDCNSSGPCQVRWKDMSTGKLLYFTASDLDAKVNTQISHYAGNTCTGGDVAPTYDISFDPNGGTLEAPRAEYPDVQFNVERGTDMMVVFTGGGNTGTNSYGTEVIVDSTGKVTDVISGVGNATIPSGGFVISGHRNAAYWLADTVKVGEYASYDTQTKKVAIGTKNACLAYGKQVSGKYGELPVPTRNGYAFDGWYTAVAGGTKVTADSALANNADHTLYAKWSMALQSGKYPYVSQIEYNGKRYVLYDAPVAWDRAKAYCESMGGHLATITTKEESDFIKSFIDLGERTGYWLGGTDEIDNKWKWVTGETFEFDDWHVEQPDNSGNREHYLEINKSLDYQWNDDSIDKFTESVLMTQGFICEFEEEPVGVEYYYNGNKYIRFDIPYTWSGAEAYSFLLGGNLVAVETEEENEFIKEIVSEGSQTGYWLGGTDSRVEDEWYWTSGEPLVFDDWYTNQPDNSGDNEHYLEIRKDFNYQWNDDSNDKFDPTVLLSQGFICEIENYITEPYINAEVEKNGTAYTVTVESGNIEEGKIYVAGYNDNGLVEAKTLNSVESVTLNGSIKKIKVMVWDELTPVIASETIIKPEWIEEDGLVWVLKDLAPEGVDIIDTKYTYDLTTYTESEESILDGWSCYDSEWVEKESSTFNYASFPSGFDTNSSYYKNFETTAMSAYENETEKCEVSTAHAGYIYWHWCRNSYTNGPINRWVEDAYKSTSMGNFHTFHAFDSTTNATTSDGETCYQYSNGNCCKDSYWYYKLPYYSCTYTKHNKLFKYSKVESVESDSYPTDESASNIKEWVCYVK